MMMMMMMNTVMGKESIWGGGQLSPLSCIAIRASLGFHFLRLTLTHFKEEEEDSALDL